MNLPTRGIGTKTLDTVRNYARANACSMWQAAAATINELSGRLGQNLHAFLVLIEQLDQQTRSLPLHEQVDHIINASGLVAHYKQDKGDRGEAKVENLDELVTAARGYEADEATQLTALANFLSHAVLESGEQQADEWEDSVQMMTLHSAKGLEFPLVFLCGMEDGLFPQPALDHRSGRPRGGTASVLRGHDPRHEAAVSVTTPNSAVCMGRTRTARRPASSRKFRRSCWRRSDRASRCRARCTCPGSTAAVELKKSRQPVASGSGSACATASSVRV